MTTNSYESEDFKAKEAFVQDALSELHPGSVLDVGCNTGHFSGMAARSGARVVAIDYDPEVVGRVWDTAIEEKLDILPLVVNLARPTPSVGWLNRECSSFLDRARGSFDMVLMLAVLHHLLVSERIPLHQVMELAAGMTTDGLVIEFVPTTDVMFRRIARGRESLFEGLTEELFEKVCRSRFDIVRSQLLKGGRRLYLLRKRKGELEVID